MAEESLFRPGAVEVSNDEPSAGMCLACGRAMGFHRRMMRHSLKWAVGMWLALSPAVGLGADASGNASATSSADAALRAFYQRRLDTWFRLEPTTATLLGDHRFDDQLEDVSKASRARWVAETRAMLKALPKAVDETVRFVLLRCVIMRDGDDGLLDVV